MELLTPEFLRYVASLGVGGLIAGLMFLVYRKDAKQWGDQWRGQSDLLTKVVVENTKAITLNTEITRVLARRIEQRIEDDHG